MTLPPGLQAIIDKHSRDRHPHGPKTTSEPAVYLELWNMIPAHARESTAQNKESKMGSKELTLAMTIQSLTYGEMIEVARSLRDMVQGRVDDDIPFDTASEDEWADLLHPWAEGIIDASKEEAA